jgi:hypothetical protein
LSDRPTIRPLGTQFFDTPDGRLFGYRMCSADQSLFHETDLPS